MQLLMESLMAYNRDLECAHTEEMSEFDMLELYSECSVGASSVEACLLFSTYNSLDDLKLFSEAMFGPDGVIVKIMKKIWEFIKKIISWGKEFIKRHDNQAKKNREKIMKALGLIGKAKEAIKDKLFSEAPTGGDKITMISTYPLKTMMISISNVDNAISSTDVSKAIVELQTDLLTKIVTRPSDNQESLLDKEIQHLEKNTLEKESIKTEGGLTAYVLARSAGRGTDNNPWGIHEFNGTNNGVRDYLKTVVYEKRVKKYKNMTPDKAIEMTQEDLEYAKGKLYSVSGTVDDVIKILEGVSGALEKAIEVTDNLSKLNTDVMPNSKKISKLLEMKSKLFSDMGKASFIGLEYIRSLVNYIGPISDAYNGFLIRIIEKKSEAKEYMLKTL